MGLSGRRRCAWLPANLGEDTAGQKLRKRQIQAAIHKSLSYDRKTIWPGVRVTISKNCFAVNYSPNQPRGRKGTSKGGQFIKQVGSKLAEGTETKVIQGTLPNVVEAVVSSITRSPKVGKAVGKSLNLAIRAARAELLREKQKRKKR